MPYSKLTLYIWLREKEALLNYIKNYSYILGI